jgi:hypothetical protein
VQSDCGDAEAVGDRSKGTTHEWSKSSEKWSKRGVETAKKIKSKRIQKLLSERGQAAAARLRRRPHHPAPPRRDRRRPPAHPPATTTSPSGQIPDNGSMVKYRIPGSQNGRMLVKMGESIGRLKARDRPPAGGQIPAGRGLAPFGGWPNAGLATVLATVGQILVEFWSNAGQILVRLRGALGPVKCCGRIAGGSPGRQPSGGRPANEP